jgi:stearoyl-CoA desaturase (delta-9 desaturase)
MSPESTDSTRTAAQSPAQGDAQALPNPTSPPRRDRLPLPDQVVPGRILWAYAIPILLVHLLALLALAPWFFSWTGVIVMLLGVHVFGQGITLCYHRLLTHRSFKVPRWLEHFFVLVALCCMEDTPAKWVATHRFHHNHSDEQPDPHSPLVTFLWGHMGWLVIHNTGVRSIAVFQKYAPDILRDSFYMKLEKRPWLAAWIYLAHAALFFLAGFAAGFWMSGQWMAGVQFGASLLVWGVILRTVAVWHITWSVNSITHLFGYRNYETGENSRNNWLVALLSVGEGWHNNHHEDPASASVQHRWWELDITYYEIRLLALLGLASDVIVPKHQRRAHRATAAE